MTQLFLSKQKIVETFSTLLGLINGIQADSVIKAAEVNALIMWLKKHEYLAYRDPFSEIIFMIKAALADGVLTEEEISDIKYVCSNFLKNYGSGLIGELHGLVSGIAVDRELHESEWTTLQEWVNTNNHLKGKWPYDEIEALITKYRSASNLTTDESKIVIAYFNDFCGFNAHSDAVNLRNEPAKAITAICAICPLIEMDDKVFCITGQSQKHPRKEISDKIIQLGGGYQLRMSGIIDYLVVCGEGSQMWVYSTYGRKIEMAMELRKKGHHIQIIHEVDLFDYFQEVA